MHRCPSPVHAATQHRHDKLFQLAAGNQQQHKASCPQSFMRYKQVKVSTCTALISTPRPQQCPTDCRCLACRLHSTCMKPPGRSS